MSLARALLKDAPVVLLDEVTSAVDPSTEKRLQHGLARLVEGKTLPVVAHRLTTISSAREIIVLDDGRVAQRGTHGALLGEPGLYSRLWEQRTRAAGWRLTSPAAPARG